MLKLVSWILFIIVALAICALSIANRHNVGFSLDPLPFTFELPLFALLLVAAFIGLLLGSATTWLKGSKVRSENRQNRREVATLKGQVVKLSRDLEQSTGTVQDNKASPAPHQIEHTP
jgi:uncharacterized integral membrane protein